MSDVADMGRDEERSVLADLFASTMFDAPADPATPIPDEPDDED